jgi:hypothetical protein
MDLDGELLEIVKEVAALKIVAVKLGDAVDRLDGMQSGASATFHSLIREVERDVRQIDIKLAAVRERLGMEKGELVMGDKVEITGADIKGSHVGTGGQNSSPSWLKYVIWGSVLIAALAVAGAMRLDVITSWFSVESQQVVE